ncbi:MAG TPA: copper resistance system multicopper oxidase [Pseudomonadales bacterium]
MRRTRTFDAGRRRLLKAGAAAGALGAFTRWLPAYAGGGSAAGSAARVAGGAPRDVAVTLAVRGESLRIAGRRAAATTLNGSLPGPLIELWEGREAVLRIENHLDEDTSVHWHGVLLPYRMDGVPGVSFPGISPGETFEARFPVRQYGTYWYHSHSGLQEQTGLYGPLVIHPREPEPFRYERDYVVVLSDWTFENPYRLLARLKKQSTYYNYQQRTLAEFVRDVREEGLEATLQDRLAWGRMRMTPTDIADVSGATYTYLMNGLDPLANWTALYRPGERVRLRLINASAMTYFNVRIPDVPMTVVQADGQNVEPVETDELQIAVAETYDVIVTPPGDGAHTLMAESLDRSGFARGTLAPRPGLTAPVPPLREPPRRTMIDMGMDHGSGHGAHGEHAHHHGTPAAQVDHAHHHAAPARVRSAEPGPRPPGPVVARHGPDGHGPGNTAVAEIQRNRLAEPGAGFETAEHRVLTYADLRNAAAPPDRRAPSHTLELHLTGNMERYMWSFDGRELHEVNAPIHFPYGERIRLVLVNDTMMEHPIHLHGMFMELENGQSDRLPFKHTLSVKPAERVSLLISANEPGPWAFHCHLLYHMQMGMMRVVEVAPAGGLAHA